MRPLLLALFCCAASFAATRYEIDLANASSHILAVTIDTECPKAECDFQMPVWNATYQVRDFVQYITGFQAAGLTGERLSHQLLKPSRWRVAAQPGERVRIKYDYLANVPGPFGCSASDRHVFLNFAEILAIPVDQRWEPVSVTFRNRPLSWKIALELPETKGAYRAGSYDELADAPVEMSGFREAAYLVGGKRVRVVVDAAPDAYNLKLLEETTHKIALAATHIMRDVPFPSYTFIYHFREGGGGGMEHANSTAIDANAPCADCNLAGVTAHEFFHLWNVKRIRPRSLEPIDYSQEMITPSLWFSEGVTSTYGSYTELQAGLLTRDEFLKRLGEAIAQHENIPAHLEQSAEESSIDAWLERYPPYGRPARSISYYLKGELAGYLLDLTIRHDSANKETLDDVMRRLNTEYAQKGKFFEDTAALERLASEAAGRDLKDFFDQVVRRPAPVDWDRYLAYAGLQSNCGPVTTPALGVEISRAPGRGASVADVLPGGAAEKAGVRPGDRIVSVNGKTLAQGLRQELQALHLEPGAHISLGLDRKGQEVTVEASPSFVSSVACQVAELPGTDALAQSIRRAWLRLPEASTIH